MMSERLEVRNARITSTMLGGEDHGFLTFYLYLDYGGSCQGAGGYGIGRWRDLTANTSLGVLLMRIMQVAGVEKWEDLPGKYIRVKATMEKVVAIAPVLSDDGQWLDFKEFFDHHQEEK